MLASPLNKIYLLCGSAGSSKEIDVLRQALHVVRKYDSVNKMTNIIGTIGAVLFLLKVGLHILLLGLINSEVVRDISTPQSIGRIQTFFFFYEDVPTNLKWLRHLINVLWCVSVLLLTVFLIRVNTT